MSMNGIDISKWQKGLKLSNIKCDFVIIKATEGATYKDPQFDDFVRQAQALGKPMGFYHFARPDNGNTAAAEARNFYNAVKPYVRQGILCLDWEKGDLSKTDWALAWLNEVKELTGVKPLVYTSQWVMNTYDWSKVAEGDYGLWIAKWADKEADYNYDMSHAGSKPKIKWWPFCAIWQWTSSGVLDGWKSYLDCDVFYGDMRAWNLYAGKPEETTYTVKPGDTLTDIAAQFHTSVDSIVAKNNLIVPGQILLI